MKRFNIVVNGRAYDVQVDELAPGAAPAAPAPAPAPVYAAPAPAAMPYAAGSTKINAPMPGNILDVKVNVGDHVEANQLVLMLEAMKMENEIFTPVAGTVVGVHVKKGDSVNSDDLLISIG